LQVENFNDDHCVYVTLDYCVLV